MATLMGSGASFQSSAALAAACGEAGLDPGGDEPDLSLSQPSLATLVHRQVIPRLLLACSDRASGPRLVEMRAIEPAEIQAFAPLPLELEAEELLIVVEGLIRKGVSVESVFVDLLAHSARRLGQFWEEDGCDFLDVTVGLWRLQQVMCEIALRYPPPPPLVQRRRSALFSAMPGDSHHFGTLMVEEFFARAGWGTQALVGADRRELLQALADRSFDVAGLTVSCDCPNGALADLIGAMRNASRNREILIFIGGRMINADPDIVADVGADGTAVDARALLSLADRQTKGVDLIARLAV